jgi:hypothetical protein
MAQPAHSPGLERWRFPQMDERTKKELTAIGKSISLP